MCSRAKAGRATATPETTPTDVDGRLLSDRARMLKPLDADLPLINAGVRYSNDRLADEAPSVVPPSALCYLPDLVGLTTLRESHEETSQPWRLRAGTCPAPAGCSTGAREPDHVVTGSG